MFTSQADQEQNIFFMFTIMVTAIQMKTKNHGGGCDTAGAAAPALADTLLDPRATSYVL